MRRSSAMSRAANPQPVGAVSPESPACSSDRMLLVAADTNQWINNRILIHEVLLPANEKQVLQR